MKIHSNAFLSRVFLEYNQKFSMRCHRGFDQARSELIEMFDKLEGRVTG